MPRKQGGDASLIIGILTGLAAGFAGAVILYSTRQPLVRAELEERVRRSQQSLDDKKADIQRNLNKLTGSDDEKKKKEKEEEDKAAKAREDVEKAREQVAKAQDKAHEANVDVGKAEEKLAEKKSKAEEEARKATESNNK